MSTILDTTLVSTGMETTSSVATYVVEEGRIVPERIDETIETLLAMSTTTVTTNSIANNNQKKECEMYSSAYVESMTDEDLESALQKMNLLVENNEIQNQGKTL